MLLQGFPLTPIFPHGFSDTERFWYWRGASGKKYIHSVYPSGLCPPLPGAIYVAVKRTGTCRTVLAISRFDTVWDGRFSDFEDLGADEIHVHLLARNHTAAEAVLADLQSALNLFTQPDPAFQEDPRAYDLILSNRML